MPLTSVCPMRTAPAVTVSHFALLYMYGTFFAVVKNVCLPPFSASLLHWAHPSSPEPCPTTSLSPKCVLTGHYPGIPSAPAAKKQKTKKNKDYYEINIGGSAHVKGFLEHFRS